MARLNIFSRRKREQNRLELDPLKYDEIDVPTRVRIVHLVNRYFDFQAHGANHVSSYPHWEQMRGWLREELGVFELPGVRGYSSNPAEEVLQYFVAEDDVLRAVDCIEIFCKCILLSSREYHRLEEPARQAIDGINGWLREASIGYEFVVGETPALSEIVEISNRVSHAEMVLPALHLLSSSKFKTADSEFRAALDHLRKKEFGDAISEAAKSLETTLKVIAADKNWVHDPEKDTLKKLLDIAISNGSVDSLWQSHFASVRTLLEAGIGTARNRFDSHGQGAVQREVPEHLARFAVMQAAVAILFFATANGYS